MSRTWTTLEVLEWTTDRFARTGVASPRLDAQVLLAHVLECDRVTLYMRFDKPLIERELAAFRALIQRRLAGEPVAYLVGYREFWSLRFRVDSRVLVPRPETETLVEVALAGVGDRAPAAAAMLDVGTGSGAIAVALATEVPGARVIAVDASPAALEVAAENARTHGVADRIEFRAGDLLAPLAADERFDVVVANLPYVPTAEIDRLAPEARSEPRSALDGGPDGLALLRRLIDGVAVHLGPGGRVALEHGADQGTAVRQLLGDAGFDAAQTHRDLAGRDRVTTANLPGGIAGCTH